MQEKHKKAWGEYYVAAQDASSIVVCNSIFQGGYCSVHYHERHTNSFSVVSGYLEIGMFNDDGELECVKSLLPGMAFSLHRLQRHQFYAKKDTVVMEWYSLFPTGPGQIATLDDISRLPGLHLGGITSTYPYASYSHDYE